MCTAASLAHLPHPSDSCCRLLLLQTSPLLSHLGHRCTHGMAEAPLLLLLRHHAHGPLPEPSAWLRDGSRYNEF